MPNVSSFHLAKIRVQAKSITLNAQTYSGPQWCFLWQVISRIDTQTSLNHSIWQHSYMLLFIVHTCCCSLSNPLLASIAQVGVIGILSVYMFYFLLLFSRQKAFPRYSETPLKSPRAFGARTRHLSRVLGVMRAKGPSELTLNFAPIHFGGHSANHSNSFASIKLVNETHSV